MRLIDKLAAEARRHKATVDQSLSGITVDAPQGHVWSATFAHSLVQSTEEDGKSVLSHAVRTLMEDMRSGTMSCVAPTCGECADRARFREIDKI